MKPETQIKDSLKRNEAYYYTLTLRNETDENKQWKNNVLERIRILKWVLGEK